MSDVINSLSCSFLNSSIFRSLSFSTIACLILALSSESCRFNSLKAAFSFLRAKGFGIHENAVCIHPIPPTTIDLKPPNCEIFPKVINTMATIVKVTKAINSLKRRINSSRRYMLQYFSKIIKVNSVDQYILIDCILLVYV